jgi:hypothetical protein
MTEELLTCGEYAGSAAAPEADHEGDPGHADGPHFGGALFGRRVLFAASASARSLAATGAQASGQGAVAAGRSSASARGNAAGTSPPDDASGNPARGSSGNGVLKPRDSTRGKPGDPVTARTTQTARTGGNHSQRERFDTDRKRESAEGQTGSSMGIVFDQAVTRDRHEIPLPHIGIRWWLPRRRAPQAVPGRQAP